MSKFIGGKELDRALGELSKSAGRGVLRRAGRIGLEPFDEAWRPKVPVRAEGRERKAPHLKDTGGVGSKLKSRRGVRRESAVEVFAGPGPDPQAVQQEFGNKNHPAQPAVRPAWDATKNKVLARTAEALGDEIMKAARRQAKRAAKLKSKRG